MSDLVSEQGRAGCVLPTGIATDHTTRYFFQEVVKTKSLLSLFGFENNSIFFPDVHGDNPFCLFTMGSGIGPSASIADFVFFANSVDELEDYTRRFKLSPEDIAILNPNTRTCPVFRSRLDAELAKAIYRRVPVLVREARDGHLEQNPWNIRLRQGLFNMTSDSNLFYTREALAASGYRLEGNVFRRNGEEYLPLFESKMIHHFDHRWASFKEAGAKDVTTHVSLAEKQIPSTSALPRYWVEAREVYICTADLPAELLTALRTSDTSLILLGLSHLLFGQWLRSKFSKNSTDTIMEVLFPSWIEFVEYHPFARGLPPIQLGLCDDRPVEISETPPGPSWLPNAPTGRIQSGWTPLHSLASRKASFPIGVSEFRGWLCACYRLTGRSTLE